MIDIKALGQLQSDCPYNVHAFAHHLVINHEVGAEGINIGSDCPDVDIMCFINTRNIPDRINYLRHVNMFGDCLQ